MPTAGLSSSINSNWSRTQGGMFKEFSRSAVWSLRWHNIYATSLLYLLLTLQFRTVLLHCEDTWGWFPQRLSLQINIAQSEPLEKHHTTGTLSIAALQRAWAILMHSCSGKLQPGSSPAWGNADVEFPLSSSERTTETEMC